MTENRIEIFTVVLYNNNEFSVRNVLYGGFKGKWQTDKRQNSEILICPKFLIWSPVLLAFLTNNFEISCKERTVIE